MRVLKALLLSASLAAAQVDPKAPCPNATPSSAQCCYSNKKSPVMGGVDFVDLASKKQGVDAPVFGSASFTAELSGFTFHFLTSQNRDAFNADPWSFAPAYDNRTFLNKGQTPMTNMLNDLANLVKTGDANWAKWFGTDKSKWIFNTACCADTVNYRMATCGPAPCTDKCDDTGECAGKCADLVKKYPCDQYYAPGKEYAGWCDKTCGYGACKKTNVFPLFLGRSKKPEGTFAQRHPELRQSNNKAAAVANGCSSDADCDVPCDEGMVSKCMDAGQCLCVTAPSPPKRPCVNKCDLPENANYCTNLQCEELVQKFPCDAFYAPGKQFAGWCDKQCGYGSCPAPSPSPLKNVRPEILRLVYGL